MSKTIVGEVVQINLSTQVAKKAGGTYPGWKMIYNTTDGKTETIAKHANSLKFKPALREALESLAAGDAFTMELEKEGEYWEIQSLRKGNEMPTQTFENSAGTTVTPRKYVSDKTSTYETPEERALRQALIVRQSCLSSAIEFLDGTADVKQAIKIAKQFEDYVWDGYDNKKSPVKTAAADAPEVA